jgi:hypothetical protein
LAAGDHWVVRSATIRRPGRHLQCCIATTFVKAVEQKPAPYQYLSDAWNWIEIFAPGSRDARREKITSGGKSINAER